MNPVILAWTFFGAVAGAIVGMGIASKQEPRHTPNTPQTPAEPQAPVVESAPTT